MAPRFRWTRASEIESPQHEVLRGFYFERSAPAPHLKAPLFFGYAPADTPPQVTVRGVSLSIER